MFDFYSLIVPLALLAGAMLLIRSRWYGYQFENVSPDALRFDLESGDLVSAGDRVSRLLGYPHSEQCLGQYHAHVHFVNCGLHQLASGRMRASALALQDCHGLPLPQALRVRSDYQGRYLEISIADQSERRLQRSSEVNLPQIDGSQPNAEPPTTHLSALLTLLEAQANDERFYAVHDRATGRLFVTQSLLARMGLISRDRWLPESLWLQCILDRNRTPSNHAPIDLANCGPRISVVTMRGEGLLFDLDVLSFDDGFLLEPASASRNASPAASLEKHFTSELVAEDDGSAHAALMSASATDSQAVDEPRYQWLRLGLSEQISASGTQDIGSPNSLAAPNPPWVGNLTATAQGASDCLAEADDYSGLKLLVVEDDDLIRKAIRPAIEKLGVAFSMAKTLAGALERFAAEGPHDVILTDLNLGADTSRPLIEQVRRESPETIVVLMTGSPVELEGVHQVIAKPFSHDYLRITVEWACMRAKLERRNRESTRV